jgi:phosphoribosylformylglycinamidine cyclo-ligase
MSTTPLSYKDAGVDIDAGDALVERIKPLAKKTMREGVLAGIGGFGALFEVPKRYREPVLVSGTDGVGTKLKLARALGKHDTVGIDLVAMSVNDLVVTGARPLFFLDYIAMGKVDKKVLLALVKGIVDACEESRCALLGGETAEMPGLYESGDYDLAGFCVGAVDRKDIIDGSKVRLGDDVIALPSSGLHSNGYSLARKIVEKRNLKAKFGSSTLGRTLLAPTRLYARPVRAVLDRHPVHAMANITGGGMVENIPRVIPKGLAVEIREGSWTVPPIFPFLQETGDVPTEEMYRVFNMGVGMVLLTAPKDTPGILRTLAKAGEKPRVVGKVVKGSREVHIR